MLQVLGFTGPLGNSSIKSDHIMTIDPNNFDLSLHSFDPIAQQYLPAFTTNVSALISAQSTTSYMLDVSSDGKVMVLLNNSRTSDFYVYIYTHDTVSNSYILTHHPLNQTTFGNSDISHINI